MGYDLYDLTIQKYSRRALPAPFKLNLPAQTIWGAPYQGNALYVKDAVRYALEGCDLNLSPVKILKLCAIYELHLLPDCAAELITNFRDRISHLVDVECVLDLLTPRLNGKQLSYRDYLKAFCEDVTQFYPK